MKVLFVSSGKTGGAGHVVKNQGDSLHKAGIAVDYLLISPGISGYLNAIREIRKVFRTGEYDLVHAHYSLSAFSATIAGVRPLFVSLMGSDVYAPWPAKILLWILSAWRWDVTIVKTDGMKQLIKTNKSIVLPNGVDTDRFAPVDRLLARRHLNFSSDKNLIVFIGGKNRPEKNYNLAVNAVKSLNDSSVEFIHINDKQNSEIPWYLNAADLLLLTSKREGSVNVVKEAMACNCPIVSTDVGDVRQLTSGVEGCFITAQDVNSIAGNIRQALAFAKRTNGRERIFELGLDSVSVANALKELYDEKIGN